MEYVYTGENDTLSVDPIRYQVEKDHQWFITNLATVCVVISHVDEDELS